MEVVLWLTCGETEQFIQEWNNPHEQGINILNIYVGIILQKASKLGGLQVQIWSGWQLKTLGHKDKIKQTLRSLGVTISITSMVW